VRFRWAAASPQARAAYKYPDVAQLRLRLCSNTEANRIVSNNVTAALRAANPHTKCAPDVMREAVAGLRTALAVLSVPCCSSVTISATLMQHAMTLE
jgi:hypothetical protein